MSSTGFCGFAFESSVSSVPTSHSGAVFTIWMIWATAVCLECYTRNSPCPCFSSLVHIISTLILLGIINHMFDLPPPPPGCPLLLMHQATQRKSLEKSASLSLALSTAYYLYSVPESKCMQPPVLTCHLHSSTNA